MLLEIRAEHPEPRKIARAVQAIEAGEVIAFPTDAAYALGCDFLNKKAVDRLYQLKQMNKGQPLSLICPDLSDLARYAHVDNQVYRILRRLLPGPYSFILEATREVPKMFHSERRTIGIRVPDHEVPQAITRLLGRPIIVTTANVHGQDPFMDPREISSNFSDLSLVLDAGWGSGELTTVVDMSGGGIVVVREGKGPIDAL